MATVKRTNQSNVYGKEHECSDCEQIFIYGPGFPENCPECGAPFTDTEYADGVEPG